VEKNMAKFLIGVALAMTLAAGTAAAQSVGRDARVNLRVEGRALSDIVQYLREQSGANIVVLEGADENISLELSDVPWRDALDIAAEAAECVVVERTGGILVVERPARVSYETQGTDITQVIDLIAKLGGANIVVAPEVSGTLSLRLNNVPWRDALDVAVKTLGYVVVEENRGILRVVDPVSLQAQMITKSYQLRFLRPDSKFKPQIKSEFLMPVQANAARSAGGSAADAVEKTFMALQALRKALSPGGEMDYILSQNVIIVRDTVAVHESIRDMINRLDVEPAQIFCDVKFVSTFNGESLDLGVDYGDGGPQVSVSGGQIPVTLPFELGDGGFEDGIIVNDGGIGPFADSALNAGNTIIPDTIYGALNFNTITATLKMYQRDTRSDVIQAPKLIVLDGNEGTIFVGETIRYAQASSQQGQSGGLELAIEEADNSPVETGFQLLVQPHVIPGTSKVDMLVIPKETTLTGTGDPSIAPPGFDVFTVGASGLAGTIALPRERSSTLVSDVLLDSGQTAILGGLSTDQDSEVVSEVPFFADIPLLGWFFQHKSRTRDKQMLWVFVTPTVVRSSHDQQRLIEREVLRRQDAYGERLQQILFGDDPVSSGHELMPAPTQPISMETTPPASAPGMVTEEKTTPEQLATFVQTPADPADQKVIEQVEAPSEPK
jgi:type IV pilus assembly protein PilQ